MYFVSQGKGSQEGRFSVLKQIGPGHPPLSIGHYATQMEAEDQADLLNERAGDEIELEDIPEEMDRLLYALS